MDITVLREEITSVDDQIIRLIGTRQQIAGRIARVKYSKEAPIRDEGRRQEVLEHAFNRAVEEKIDPRSVRQIFEILIEMSEERQHECIGEGDLP
ncbi:chorismate mutase [Methanosphaerula palustris]|uniref:Chorismate mutase n=1 Tax=Methanosphaerula palustris (strain ATCC BAA-1556 / DSM 19958 / E1-9c) TaxID=521011 RepID=B8GKZ5_METPE|nr:chorismate mutase [Methanosphaerula palustris]ACL17291.1 Chorismate mutase [Methanosphaerula palustris E1-9c]